MANDNPLADLFERYENAQRELADKQRNDEQARAAASAAAATHLDASVYATFEKAKADIEHLGRGDTRVNILQTFNGAALVQEYSFKIKTVGRDGTLVYLFSEGPKGNPDVVTVARRIADSEEESRTVRVDEVTAETVLQEVLELVERTLCFQATPS